MGASRVAGRQVRTDRARAHAQALDDRRGLLARATLEQLRAELLESRLRALVERVRRLTELAQHLEADAFDAASMR